MPLIISKWSLANLGLLRLLEYCTLWKRTNSLVIKGPSLFIWHTWGISFNNVFLRKWFLWYQLLYISNTPSKQLKPFWHFCFRGKFELSWIMLIYLIEGEILEHIDPGKYDWLCRNCKLYFISRNRLCGKLSITCYRSRFVVFL